MIRPPQTPTRPRTRLRSHGAAATLLALLLLAVAPGAKRSADRHAAPTACDPDEVTLHARIDAHRLGQGGPGGGIARLHLEVEGTRAPIRIELINRTPGVIGLEGGDIQVSTSTGGVDNRLEREVLTHRAGDLEIRYRLADSACPDG